jgi:hypothetical protein
MMKVVFSSQINSFGGLNFVHHELESLNIQRSMDSFLPKLPVQSVYSWKDILYSLLSIYFCGGDCIEDAKTVLSKRFGFSPFFKLSSPDTILRRLKELSTQDLFCQTPRGTVTHQYNINDKLARLNIQLLKSWGAFDQSTLILDYDNTIVFNEKADSRMTYKRANGYQPGVCFLNEDKVLYLENRNGNSDAKAFQSDTLQRMFDLLEDQGIVEVDKFRADAASYQFEVVSLLEQKVKHFYIGGRNDYIESYFNQIDHWEKTLDKGGEEIWIGEVTYQPFHKRYKASQTPPTYRILVKRKRRKDRQADLFTKKAYDYRAVVTNDFDCSIKDGLNFYYHRGAVERQFDVLKNDFGWAHLPFSRLSENTVFLYFTGLIKNLYSHVLRRLSLSGRFKKLTPKIRIKRFVFKFIAIPARWIRKARQWYLRLYGSYP